MKRPPPPSRTGLLLLCGVLTLGIAALLYPLFRYQTGVSKIRNDFVQFVSAAATAARTDDIAKMRRLYLNDAFLEDPALRQIFADFGRLSDEDIHKLEPDYADETYCWLRLPDSHTRHKLIRAQGDWVIQGDVVPLDR